MHQVAHSYGKTATFLPKPVIDDNGSGMHVHQSIFKGDKSIFAGNGYADLSESALFYIGGIITHARAINAFANPTTNSYKRLIPGFEAPVLLAYSARNRSASCRIPYALSPNGKRVEVRFPDAVDKNLYDLPPEELKDIPTVCSSLREAVGALEEDRDFLTKGDVFTDEQISAYTDLKWEEIYRFEHTPHPVEFDMYYSV